MPIQSTDIFRTIEPVTQKWFGLSYKKQKAVFSQLAWTESTDEAVFDVTEYGGPNILEERQENEPLKESELIQGWSRRFFTKNFGSIMTISKEALDDTRWGDIKRCASSMGRAARVTPEMLFAQFMDNAWGGGSVSADNVQLFSTSHTLPKGGTYANCFTNAMQLSEEAIEQLLVNLQLIPATDGNIQPLQAVKLAITPQNEALAWKLKNSRQSVGSNVNDRSYVEGKLDPVVNPWFSQTYPNRWFVTTDVTHDEENGLFWKWREKPTYGRDQTTRTRQALFFCVFRASWGMVDARGAYGSNAV